MKRIYGSTPNGGVYSEIYYFDADDKSVEDAKDAVRAIGCEYDEDDNLIMETFLVLSAE